MSIDRYAELRYMYLWLKKGKFRAKTRLAQPSALKILIATSKIPLAASLRWPS